MPRHSQTCRPVTASKARTAPVCEWLIVFTPRPTAAALGQEHDGGRQQLTGAAAAIDGLDGSTLYQVQVQVQVPTPGPAVA